MLHLHRASRADGLLSALGDVLLQPAGGPMTPEVVAVPTRGVERWLAQRLSHRLGSGPAGCDGVSANIEFPSPASLLAVITTAVCGPLPGAARAGPPGARWRAPEDPWSPDRCVWPLIELVDEHLSDGRLAPLAEYLRRSSPGAGVPELRRFSMLRKLATLYDRYALYRPEMVLAWKEGHDLVPASRPEDALWQSHLWRLLRERLAYPSPAERAAEAPELILSEPGRLDLPERLSVFGLTRLPASQLRVLKAVAQDRAVHLFLLHPSEALWQRVAGQWEGTPPRGLARAADAGLSLPDNPFLRSWGRDVRELQVVLAAEGIGGGTHWAPEPAPGPPEPPPGAPEPAAGPPEPAAGPPEPAAGPPEPAAGAPDQAPTTLLGRLQADIRADRAPLAPNSNAGAPALPLLGEDDESLRVHSCHGAARQVEVAREAVLHLLAADPTLEPRDVIIMCPDIERFAPLVQATFNAARPAGSPPLRARLADRSLRQTNPMLGVAGQLLELAGGRVTAAQVHDFASREPVSRRFGFTEDELSRAEGWLRSTGVRWGLDAVHRARWHLEAVSAGTWRTAIDRLLLGVAMSEDESRLFGGALPLDDVGSSDIELVGRLAELVLRLGTVLGDLRGPQVPADWALALARGAEALALAPPDEAWQTEELRAALEEATGAGQPTSAQLSLAEAGDLLADALRGRPTRANFRTGDMTVCTLVPMRSVPHRVVCLLGLDDGLFPRPADEGGEDLLLAEPLVGDRDGPSEDRQLLLDALMAAQDHLVITYEGRDQRLNQHRPPSVPVSELLEVVDQTVRRADGRPARETVLVQHPLQPFDPANYEPGRLGLSRPWRFDAAHLDGARALGAPRHPPAPFLAGPLPPLPGAVIELGPLVRFLEHPVRAFLRQRVGLYAAGPPEPLPGSLPVELGPLERWALGDRLLQSCLSGTPRERALAAERGRGLLPPGPLGEAALAEVMRVVDLLLVAATNSPTWPSPPSAVEVSVPLPDGGVLVGTVPGVRGGTVLRCTYSKLGPKHRLRAWAYLLALSAMCPELCPRALTIGQSQGSSLERPRLSQAHLEVLGPDPERTRAVAIGHLAALADLYRRGMREPLPLYCATSWAWVAAASALEDPVEAARRCWAPNYDELDEGEAAEPEHVAVLGPGKSFAELCEEPPRPDEGGRGWEMAETSRLGRLAFRLWSPVLEYERCREG